MLRYVSLGEATTPRPAATGAGGRKRKPQGRGRGRNYFGDLYRRWKARLGEPKAVTAIGHKRRACAGVLKFKQEFDWQVFAKEEEKMKRKKLARLFNMAESLNYQLIPKQ